MENKKFKVRLNSGDLDAQLRISIEDEKIVLNFPSVPDRIEMTTGREDSGRWEMRQIEKAAKAQIVSSEDREQKERELNEIFNKCYDDLQVEVDASKQKLQKIIDVLIASAKAALIEISEREVEMIEKFRKEVEQRFNTDKSSS